MDFKILKHGSCRGPGPYWFDFDFGHGSHTGALLLLDDYTVMVSAFLATYGKRLRQRDGEVCLEFLGGMGGFELGSLHDLPRGGRRCALPL